MSFFWYSGQMAAGPSETFSRLVADAEATVEQVLETDEAVTQAKRRYEPLIAFFTPEKLVELISILAEEPPAECSFDRGHKFPFSASEILSAAAPEFLDKVLSCPEALQHVLALAEKPAVNLTSAAYLSGLILSLLGRSQAAYRFAFSDERLSAAVLRNLHSKSMADLLFRLLVLDATVTSPYLLERFAILRRLVKAMRNAEDPIAQINAASVLCDVIRQMEAKSWKLLICVLVQHEELEEVFKGAAEGRPGSLSVLCALMGCGVLDELSEIDLQKVIRVMQAQEEGSKEESEGDEDRDDAMISLLGDYLPEILKLLPGDQPQLGTARLLTCELVDIIFRQKSPFFEEIIVREGGLREVTKLFFQYPLNSFLHKAYESLVHTVFEKASQSVQQHLLTEVDLPTLLAQTPAIIKGPPGNSGMGSMGFITRISSYLVSKQGELSWWSPPEVWPRYAASYLARVAEVEKPRKRANSDDEADEEACDPLPDSEDPEDPEDEEEGEVILEAIAKPKKTANTYSPQKMRTLCGAVDVRTEGEADEYNSSVFWREPIQSLEELEELE